MGRYLIYGTRDSVSGYMDERGMLTAWRSNAKRFSTMSEADWFIDRHGYLNSTSVVVNKPTAYVVESLD